MRSLPHVLGRGGLVAGLLALGCAAAPTESLNGRAGGKGEATGPAATALKGRVTYPDEGGASMPASGVMVEYHDGRGGCLATVAAEDGAFDFTDKSVECAPPFALVPAPRAEEAPFPPCLAVSLRQDARLASAGAPTAEFAQWRTSHVSLHPVVPEQAERSQDLVVPLNVSTAVAFFVRVLPVINRHLSAGSDVYKLVQEQANGIDLAVGGYVLSLRLHGDRDSDDLGAKQPSVAALAKDPTIRGFVESLVSATPKQLFSPTGSACDDADRDAELASLCAQYWEDLKTEGLTTLEAAADIVPGGDVVWTVGDAAVGDGDVTSVGLTAVSYVNLPAKVVEKAWKIYDMIVAFVERTLFALRNLGSSRADTLPGYGSIAREEADTVVSEWAAALLQPEVAEESSLFHEGATLAAGPKTSAQTLRPYAGETLPLRGPVDLVTLDRLEIHSLGVASRAEQQWRLEYSNGHEEHWQVTALLTRDDQGFPRILMARLVAASQSQDHARAIESWPPPEMIGRPTE